MRSIRGFRGEGRTLGGGGAPAPVSSGPRQRQLLHDRTADSQRPQFDSESDEEELQDDVKVVTLALRLRDKTVKKQFCITDKVQVSIIYNGDHMLI